jgi:hypothetical protein
MKRYEIMGPRLLELFVALWHRDDGAAVRRAAPRDLHHTLDAAPMRIAFNRIPDLETER